MIHLKNKKKKKSWTQGCYIGKKNKKNLTPKTYTMMVKKKILKRKKIYEEGKKKKWSEEGEGNSNWSFIFWSLIREYCGNYFYFNSNFLNKM